MNLKMILLTCETQKCLRLKKNRVNLRRAMISNHLSFARKCFSLFCAAVALVIELAAVPQRADARATTQFEALPLVRSRQNHLLVRAFINGKAAWLTVDTGYSARAARFAHEQEIDGIIGADILFPTQAVLDCERQLLILKTDPGVLGSFPGFNRRGLRAVPIQVSDDYNLYVNGSVNGRPARLMVDTGSFTTLLHRSFLRRMRIATRETPYSSSAVNLKERGVRVAHIRKLSVGSVDIFAKDVGVIDLEGLIHNGLLEGS